MAILRGLQQVKNNITRHSILKMHQLLRESAYAILSEAYKLRGFQDVTRNLVNSFAVGAYYKGEFWFMVTANDMNIERPKRPSLAYGQRAKTPRGTWFKADYPKAKGGQNARSLAKETLQNMRVAKRKTYALVVVAPMEYAEWVEKERGHNVLSQVRDKIPDIIVKYVNLG